MMKGNLTTTHLKLQRCGTILILCKYYKVNVRIYVHDKYVDEFVTVIISLLPSTPFCILMVWINLVALSDCGSISDPSFYSNSPYIVYQLSGEKMFLKLASYIGKAEQGQKRQTAILTKIYMVYMYYSLQLIQCV